VFAETRPDPHEASPKRMRIGVSALFQASGGSLTHLRRLLTDWGEMGILDRHELVVFASSGTHGRLSSDLPAGTAQRIQWRIMPGSDRGLLMRLYEEQVRLPRAARRERLDCLFCPGNIVPYASSIPSVVLFQNAAPFCFGVSLRSVGFRYWVRFRLLGRMMRWSARRSTAVIFISTYFRDLFVSRFGFPPAKGTVIYHAREETCANLEAYPDVEQKHGIRRPYVLVVAHLNPYKNLVELVEAFDRARRECGRTALQLVIAGRRNHPAYYRKLLAERARLGLQEEDVRLAGEIAHQDVLALIAGCQFYVYPSTCENCPTALIEALSQGVPIACSNVGVMPEIGGEAVAYFDPWNVEDIARTLVSLMTDAELCQRLRSLARKRAGIFPDGATVARETVAFLEAAGQRGLSDRKLGARP
jgi:glycosyltransferase involved in cell wall biosynthesis